MEERKIKKKKKRKRKKEKEKERKRKKRKKKSPSSEIRMELGLKILMVTRADMALIQRSLLGPLIKSIVDISVISSQGRVKLIVVKGPRINKRYCIWADLHQQLVDSLSNHLNLLLA